MSGLFIFSVIVIAVLLLINIKEVKKLFYYFFSSFDNFSRGASANKLSAAAAIGVCIYITKRYTNTENETYVLIIWLLFALLCLGIVVFRQIVELINSYKHGNSGKTIIDDKEPLDKHMSDSASPIENNDPNQNQPPTNP